MASKKRKTRLLLAVAVVFLIIFIFNLRRKNLRLLELFETSHAVSDERRPRTFWSTLAGQGADIHVAIFGDKKLLQGIMTLATSIVNNTHSEVMLHFVTMPGDADIFRTIIDGSALGTVPHEVLGFSEDKVKGDFVVRSPRKELNHPLNMARFFMAELLPAVDRVIYVDADCLVLGDIKELNGVDIADRHVIAALGHCDILNRKVAVEVLNYNHPAVVAAKIPQNACVFNNGVFVADLSRWRVQDVGDHLIDWMKLNARSTTRVVRAGDFGAGSQAIMMLELHDKFTPLPMQWNVLSGFHSKSPRSNKLLHWNGVNKPWIAGKSQSLWRQYYDLFKSQLKERASQLFLNSSF